VRNAASPRHDRAVYHHEHRTAALSFPPDQRVQRLGHDRREVVEVGVADPAQLVRAAAVGEGCRPLVCPRDSAEPWAGPPSMGPGSRAGVLACRMPISSSWVWMHRHVPEMRDRDLLIPGRVNRKKKKRIGCQFILAPWCIAAYKKAPLITPSKLQQLLLLLCLALNFESGLKQVQSGHRSCPLAIFLRRKSWKETRRACKVFLVDERWSV
jgi:hypothetical protein